MKCFLVQSLGNGKILVVYLTGFSLGLSLIVAIGAQNMLVFRQGLLRQHVFWVCFVCALSDAILITVGVAGFATFLNPSSNLLQVAKYLAAALLFFLGAMSLRSAIRGTTALTASTESTTSLKAILATVLVVTWLNPHVYLETVLLVGAVSTRYPGQEVAFALGAITASFVFFFALGFGAKRLQPWFTTPASWRVLDAVIALIMWSIALSLILNAL